MGPLYSVNLININGWTQKLFYFYFVHYNPTRNAVSFLFLDERHAYPSEATEVCRQEEGRTNAVHPENSRSRAQDYQRRYLKWRFVANKYNINKKPNSRNRLRQKRFNWDNLLNRWADFRCAPNNSVSSWTKRVPMPLH